MSYVLSGLRAMTTWLEDAEQEADWRRPLPLGDPDLDDPPSRDGSRAGCGAASPGGLSATALSSLGPAGPAGPSGRTAARVRDGRDRGHGDVGPDLGIGAIPALDV